MPQSTPPNVLHIIHGLRTGGAEVDLVHKLRYLRERYAYPITVCCLMRRGDLALSLEAEGAEIIGPLMSNRRDMGFVPALRRLMRRQSWDVIHSHLYEASLLTGLTLATTYVRPPRWIVSEHAMADYWSALPRFMLNLMAQGASDFIVPTQTAAESFISGGLPRQRLSIIPNGVTLPAPLPGARTRVRQALEIGEDDVLVGTISRLHRVKALPILCEAASGLPVRVVIAGDGPAREELEALIAQRGWTNRMRLLGARNDTADLLAAMDVFALASLSESMSIAVAEALLAGVPVVATRTGGVPEITGDGAFARLVPPGDVGALRDGLAATLEDLTAARCAAKAGRAWVEEHLSVAAAAEQLHALYLDKSSR